MFKNNMSAFFIGCSIFLGLSTLGYLLADAVITYKQYERSVTVKGLAEKEVKADLVLWPIQFTVANNELAALYDQIEEQTKKISAFLVKNSIPVEDISVSSPSITDKSAQQWDNNVKAEFRFTADQIVTVYSTNISAVRKIMSELSKLGKQGIVFSGGRYQSKPEYKFTKLNEVKPQMVKEATKNARTVAQQFAIDSDSQLGKIKKASQGQFTIISRDRNNPHIKKIRVVSTIEYYLSD